MAQSMGISAGELYPTTGISSMANGVLTGLASLVPGLQEVERDRRKASEVAPGELQGLADVFSDRYDSEAALARRRNLGRAAGGLALEKDSTAHLANMAKYGVATVAEEYAQAMIGLGRASAARNYAAQMALAPLKECYANSDTFASRALALEAIRKHPEYANTSAAYKNEITMQRESLAKAAGVETPAKPGMLALDGSPATYHNLATKILDDRESADARAGAAASLIMLSRQTEGGVPESELRRFVPDNILQMANNLVRFYNAQGVDASNMGLMSKQGQDSLERAVRDSEQMLALFGYTLDPNGDLRGSDGAIVRPSAGGGDGADGGGSSGYAGVSDEAKTAAAGVLAARSMRDRMKQLSDEVTKKDYTAVRDALDVGAVTHIAAIGQALMADAAGNRIGNYTLGEEMLAPDQVMARAQKAHDAMTNAANLPSDPRQLAANMASFMCPDADLARGQPLSVLGGEAFGTVKQVLETGRYSDVLGTSVTLESLAGAPETTNLLAGLLLADTIIERVPDVRRAMAGTTTQNSPETLTENRNVLGKKIGNLLNEVLKDGDTVAPVFAVNENGNIEWKVLGGRDGTSGFDTVMQSVLAEAVLDTANGVVVSNMAELSGLARAVGVPVDGGEVQAAMSRYARDRIDRRMPPEKSSVTASHRGLTRVEREWMEKKDALVSPWSGYAGISTAAEGMAPVQVSPEAAKSAADSDSVVVFSATSGGEKRYFALPVGVVPVAMDRGSGVGKHSDVLCMQLLGTGKSSVPYFTPANGLGSEELNTCLEEDIAAWLVDKGEGGRVRFSIDGALVDIDPEKLFTEKQRSRGTGFCQAVFGDAPGSPDGPAVTLMSACYPNVEKGKGAVQNVTWGADALYDNDIFDDAEGKARKSARQLAANVFDFVKANGALTPNEQAYLQQVVVSTLMSAMGVGDSVEIITDRSVRKAIQAVRDAYATEAVGSHEKFMEMIGFDPEWYRDPPVRDSKNWVQTQGAFNSGLVSGSVKPSFYVDALRRMGSTLYPEGYDSGETSYSYASARALSRQGFRTTPKPFQAGNIYGQNDNPGEGGARASDTPTMVVPENTGDGNKPNPTGQ